MAGTDTSLDPLTTGGPAIVLVRPQLAENIGAAARAMANSGLSDLRLVAPRDGWPNPKATPMASGALGVLDQARLFGSLREAIADLDRVWATSARPRDLVKRVATARGAAEAMRAAVGQGARVGVVFGPERTGLETDEVIACHELIEIPLSPAFASLNLAQAVLLVGYEWFQSADQTPALRSRTAGQRSATVAEVHDFLDHFEAQLEAAGFLRHEQMRPAMMNNLKSFVMRAEPTDQEVRTLHGVLAALSGRRRHQLKGPPPADEDKALEE